ncbi:uncharacterized protein LOC135480087 isoform X2 [Liolophura sinensis]|uniref:uncharacterized protein LOC135480087 isoform X2 n=1 Tax=Liolophura sinensis TaxID=3198878 RepID=UPI003158C6CD
MAEALTKESTNGADTEPDSVTNVVAFTAADAKEGTEPSGEELSEDMKQDDDSDDENTFPFDSLDDFEVVDEVEDPVDDADNEAADKDEQNGSEEGLPEVNEDDVVMEETAEIDLESERPAEHTSQEEHGDAEEISGILVESLEDPNKEENMGEERTKELKETEEVEEGGDKAGDYEELQDEDTVEGEKGAAEEYEEEVEGEGEEVEGEEEEEMEAEEQEEYEEEEEVVEEEYIEGEEVCEEEVEEEEDEEVVEGDEEFIEGVQEVEIEEEAEEEGCELPEEQALETEVEGMAAAAKNLLNLQKAVIIYHVKPDDLKDVLLQPCLKKAVCFCVRFLGPKGCTKGGHLEARFSSQKEAKEQMEMINSTIFKNGQKMKAFLLGPGGGPMDWLLNEWQRSISPAGIFESRCVFVSNVPSFAREEMLRALYPTAESVNLPLKPDGQTNG